MFSNCGSEEDSWEPFRQQGDQTSKGQQLCIVIGSTDAEAAAPILWPSDGKSWLIGKDSNDRKDWEQEEKGIREDEMFGGHHRLDGHESEQVLGVGDGQGSLVCCRPWGGKESDTTEQLNNNSKDNNNNIGQPVGV